MEFLKGISFDIQRFADISFTGASWSSNFWVNSSGVVSGTSTGTDLAKWTAGGKSLVVVAGNTITSALSSINGGSSAVLTFGTTTAGSSGGTTTFNDGTTTFAATMAANNTLTLRNGSISSISSAASTALNITKGTLEVSAALAASSAVTLAAKETSVKYSGNLTGAVVTNLGVATSAAVTKVSVTEATNSTATVIDAAGNVSGLDTTGTVVYTGTTTGLTVTTAASATGAYTVNGHTYTVGTGNSKNLEFTLGATTAGATALTATTANTTVDVDGGALAGGLKFGNETVTSTNVAAVTITSDGSGIKDVKTTGIETFTGYGKTGTGSFTFNGKTVTVQSDGTDGISVTTDAGTTVTAFGLLSAGATLTTDVTGATVTTDTTLKNGDKVTVNSKTFTNGLKTDGTADTTLQFYIAADKTANLYQGTVYLTAGSKVTIADAAAPTTYKDVTATNGDITVTTSTGTGVVIGDLDNGDTFTIGDTTYSVVNGTLYNTTTGTPFTEATLSESERGKQALYATIANWKTTEGTAVAGKGVNLYESSGVAIVTPDVQNIVLKVTGVDTDNTTRFVREFKNGDYLHKNGTVGTSSTDAIGRLTYDSATNVITYQATSGAKAQTIDISADTSSYTFNIKGTNNADTLIGIAGANTLDGGSGNDTITSAANNVVIGGDGDDSITGAAVTGGDSLVGGAGKDTIYATQATTTLTGGAGEDSFVMGDGIRNAGTGVITDYNFSEDLVLVNSTAANMATIKAADVGEGTFTLGTTVTVNGSNGNYQLVLKGTDSKKGLVGWTGEEGSLIDFSSQSTNAVIIGTVSDSKDSLYGGTGNDTIYAGNGDTVWGGSGTNRIDLSAATESATYGFGVTSGSKKEVDTVVGFTTGFDAETADVVHLVGDTSNLKTTYTTGNLNVKMGKAETNIAAAVSGTGAAEVLFDTKKVAFIADNNTANVTSADYADLYYGTNGTNGGSGLSFASVEDDVVIDLSKSDIYKNINTITGGKGNSTLMGSSAKETLISAGGNTSLWGGAGNDVLQGASDAKDVFFLMNNGGKDTVTSGTFGVYTDATADTADVVYLSNLASAKAVSNAIELATTDGSKLVLDGVTNDTMFQFTTDGKSVAVAKIGSVNAGNSFTYDSAVNFYGGGSKVDSLSVSGSDDLAIWLDNSQGGNVTFNSIENVNAQSTTGSILLAGDSSANTLRAGTGDASLWGGSGSAADSLVGSTAGVTKFWYGFGEGNDTLVSNSADDVVNLYSGTNGITSADITDIGVVIGFNDGSKLTVLTNRNITFDCGEAGKYTANYSEKKWE